jgi:hypothetical protein
MIFGLALLWAHAHYLWAFWMSVCNLNASVTEPNKSASKHVQWTSKQVTCVAHGGGPRSTVSVNVIKKAITAIRSSNA